MKRTAVLAVFLAGGLLLLPPSVVAASATEARRPIIVVSDIDDTIKDTHIRFFGTPLPNPGAALELVRDSPPVPGMACVYQGWRRQAHAEFDYVTAAPTNWDARLKCWLARGGFPSGVVKSKDPGARISMRDYKICRIDSIIRANPRARFILVGDSGQWDREAYGEVARHHRQVKKIFIRHVTCEAKDSARYRRAFRDVLPQRWLVFSRADEIARLRL